MLKDSSQPKVYSYYRVIAKAVLKVSQLVEAFWRGEGHGDYARGPRAMWFILTLWIVAERRWVRTTCARSMIWHCVLQSCTPNDMPQCLSENISWRLIQGTYIAVYTCVDIWTIWATVILTWCPYMMIAAHLHCLYCLQYHVYVWFFLLKHTVHS